MKRIIKRTPMSNLKLYSSVRVSIRSLLAAYWSVVTGRSLQSTVGPVFIKLVLKTAPYRVISLPCQFLRVFTIDIRCFEILVNVLNIVFWPSFET